MAAGDKGWKQVLRANHQELRDGLLVENILPGLTSLLTGIEYLRVADKSGNVAQVDELVKILLTKERKHFDQFCGVCERNGYQEWAQRLQASADDCKKAPGRR